MLAASGPTAFAGGLGPISVQTSFGEPLRAVVPLLGDDTDGFDATCIRARIESIDSNTLLFSPEVGVVRGKTGTKIHISTHQNVNELALNVSIRLGCNTPVQRTYQILLDPVAVLPTVTEDASPVKTSAANTPAAQNMAESTGGNANATGPRSKRGRPADGEPSRVKEEAKLPETSNADKRKPRAAPQTDRPVLKLSGAELDLPIGADVNPDRLRMSDTLSLPSIDPDPKRREELQAAQAQLAAFLRDENLAQSAEEKLKAAKAEIETLKAEREHLQQASRNEATAHEAAKSTTNGWLLGLQGLLVLFIAATAWLLWRFYLLKKRENKHSWEELLSDNDTGSFFSSSKLDANSEFHSEFNTSQFGASGFGNTDFSTTIDTAAMEAPTVESPQTASSAPAAADTVAPPRKPRPSSKRRPSRPGSNPEQDLKVEEISDVMELAEAWMALQNPAKVLEILEPFSGVEQPESPLPWLCLLDVYRALGNREKHEAILARIKQIYNVKLAPWDPVVDAEPPKTLADFPHIVENILRTWGSDEAVAYLDGLLLDDREGTRNGFDLPVYRDILRLLDLANDPSGPRSREEITKEIAERIAAGSAPALPTLVSLIGKQETAKEPVQEEPAPQEPAPRKPQLRERPKYITTSYHRKISNPEPQPQTPAPSIPLPEISLPVADTVASPAAAGSVDEYEEMSPITIKLHLAIAYQDIGDRDGARLLLDEVIQEGTPEQVEEAKEMLTKLG